MVSHCAWKRREGPDGGIRTSKAAKYAALLQKVLLAQRLAAGTVTSAEFSKDGTQAGALNFGMPAYTWQLTESAVGRPYHPG